MKPEAVAEAFLYILGLWEAENNTLEYLIILATPDSLIRYILLFESPDNCGRGRVAIHLLCTEICPLVMDILPRKMLARKLLPKDIL